MNNNITLQEEKKIPISELHFWPDNPRLNAYEGDGSDESITDFFYRKKELQPLCGSIIQNTHLNPQERLVIYQENGKNVVYEGNRRLACYKILSNPSSIKKYNLHYLIADANQAKKISSDYEVSCLVCSKKEDAVKYVQNQHTDSFKLPWTDAEQLSFRLQFQNANEKDKKITALFDYMKQPQSGIPYGFRQNMSTRSLNNFKAIMLHPMTTSFFNLHIDRNGKLGYANDFDRKFPRVVYDIEKISHDNTSIEMSNEEMQGYLNFLTVTEGDIAKQHMEDVANSFNDLPLFPNEEKSNYPQKKTSISRSSPISTKRKYLIPSSFKKKLPRGRFNNIYKELRTSEVEKYPNAVAVLFRVFYEFALNQFAEENGFGFQQYTPMKERIKRVTDYLEKQGVDKRIVDIGRKTREGKNDFLSIEDFNAFVHHVKSYPDPTTLKNAWDELEIFLHEIIIEKE